MREVDKAEWLTQQAAFFASGAVRAKARAKAKGKATAKWRAGRTTTEQRMATHALFASADKALVEARGACFTAGPRG